MQDKAYRLAQEERIIKKRLKLVKATDSPHVYPDGKTHYEHVAEAANALNKRHPFDCGKADCMMCHGHKIHPKMGSKKRREKYKKPLLGDEDGFEDIQ